MSRVPEGSAPPMLPRPRASRGSGRRVLTDLVRQLSDGIDSLRDEDPSDGVLLAIRRLADAREALSLLALERAAGSADRQARPDDERPALERRIELAADPRSSHLGRVFVRETTRGWDVAEPLVNAAVDVSSELVANAARETRSHVLLAVTLHPRAVVVRVWDDGEGHPQLRPYRPGISKQGIGLRLVKHLSQEWGWHTDAQGKWVWALLDVPTPGEGPGPRQVAESRPEGLGAVPRSGRAVARTGP